MKLMSVVAGVVLGMVTFASVPAGEIAVGAPAPEISAREWFNSIGKAPLLSELRGQTVIIEFWATW